MSSQAGDAYGAQFGAIHESVDQVIAEVSMSYERKRHLRFLILFLTLTSVLIMFL